jgi:hypothetical protein
MSPGGEVPRKCRWSEPELRAAIAALAIDRLDFLEGLETLVERVTVLAGTSRADVEDRFTQIRKDMDEAVILRQKEEAYTSSADKCRIKGWVVGDKIHGASGTLRITAIGEEHVLARKVFPDSEAAKEGHWDILDSSWSKVDDTKCVTDTFVFLDVCGDECVLRLDEDGDLELRTPDPDVILNRQVASELLPVLQQYCATGELVIKK